MAFVREMDLPIKHRKSTAAVLEADGENLVRQDWSNEENLRIGYYLTQEPVVFGWVSNPNSCCDVEPNIDPDVLTLWSLTDEQTPFHIVGQYYGNPEIQYPFYVFESPDTSGSNWTADAPRFRSSDGIIAKLRSLWNQISEFQRLPENWDGYGGLPTTTEAGKRAYEVLSKTIALATKLRIEASVAPLADGGLDLEWIGPVGHGLLVEVPPSGEYLNYVVSRMLEDGTFKDRNGRLYNPREVATLILQMA